MKYSLKITLLLALFATLFASCKEEEDEGEEELEIEFKIKEGYIYADQILKSSTEFLVGVEASTEKAKDPIIRLTITESLNGGTPTSLYIEDLDNQFYSYDFSFTLDDEVSGNKHEYTFTIVNRDGFTKQKSLVITVE